MKGQDHCVKDGSMQVKGSWPELAGSAYCLLLLLHCTEGAQGKPTDHPLGLAKKMWLTKLTPVSYYLLESQSHMASSTAVFNVLGK